MNELDYPITLCASRLLLVSGCMSNAVPDRQCYGCIYASVMGTERLMQKKGQMLRIGFKIVVDIRYLHVF